MSRQGNYVAVPNIGGSNAMSGLSGALTDLSKIMLAKSEQEQDQTNWEIEEARRADDHAYKQQGQEARKLFAESLAGMGDREYQLSDHSADIQDHYNGLRQTINNEQDSLRQYLTSPDASLDGHIELFRDKLKDSRLKQGEIEDLVFQRTRRAEALRRELGGSEYTDDQRSERLDTALGALYNPDFERIDKEIKSGTALVQRERLAAVARGLDPRIVQHMTQEEIYQALTPNIGGETLASLRTRDSQRVQDLNKSYSDNQSAAVQAHNAQARKYGSSGSSGSRGKGVKDNYEKVLDLISDMNFDIGMFDNDDKIPALNALVSMPGVDAESAALALRLGVERQWFGFDKKLPDLDSDGFRNVMTLAGQLADRRRGVRSGSSSSSGSASSSGSYGVRYRDGQFNYDPAVQKSDVELKRDLLNFGGAETRYLDPRAEFLTGPTTRPQVVQTPSGPIVTQGNNNPAAPAAPADITAALTAPTTTTQATPADVLGALGGNNPPPPQKPAAPAGTPGREVLKGISFPTIPEDVDPQTKHRMMNYRSEMLSAHEQGRSNPIVVLPYDENGKDRKWGDIVKDINSRDELDVLGFSFDKISAKEAREAENSPAKQREILEEANEAILGTLRTQNALGKMAIGLDVSIGDGVEHLWDTAASKLGFGPEYQSKEYYDELVADESDERVRQRVALSYDNMSNYLNGPRNYGGGFIGGARHTLAGLGDATGFFMDTNTGGMVGLLGGGLAGWTTKQALKQGGKRGLKAKRSEVKKAERLRAEKNKERAERKANEKSDAAARKVQEEKLNAINPRGHSRIEEGPHGTAFDRAQLRKLTEWLQSRSSSNGPTH